MFPNEPSLLRFRGLLGVPVEIGQSTALLCLIYLGLSSMGAGDLVTSAITLAMLLGSIYLHELGHAWGSKVQGIPVRRIVIHGGGGYCERIRSGSASQQELIVAMGPIVNLVIWALASMAANILADRLFASATPPDALFSVLVWLDMLALINLALFVLNLIPVQPLDGGKLLQLLLNRVLPAPKALRLTGMIGVVFALLWWPALLYIYMNYGWLLLFAPSLRLHLAMVRGQING